MNTRTFARWLSLPLLVVAASAFAHGLEFLHGIPVLQMDFAGYSRK